MDGVKWSVNEFSLKGWSEFSFLLYAVTQSNTKWKICKGFVSFVKLFDHRLILLLLSCTVLYYTIHFYTTQDPMEDYQSGLHELPASGMPKSKQSLGFLWVMTILRRIIIRASYWRWKIIYYIILIFMAGVLLQVRADWAFVARGSGVQAVLGRRASSTISQNPCYGTVLSIICHSYRTFHSKRTPLYSTLLSCSIRSSAMAYYYFFVLCVARDGGTRQTTE